MREAGAAAAGEDADAANSSHACGSYLYMRLGAGGCICWMISFVGALIFFERRFVVPLLIVVAVLSFRAITSHSSFGIIVPAVAPTSQTRK